MKPPLPIAAASLGAVLAALSPEAGARGPATELQPDSRPAAGVATRELAGRETSDAVQASPKAIAVYKAKCQACHGPRGEGDGPGAKQLNPKPRSFRDPSWQQSVSDEQIRKATTDGGAGVGKSPAMPAVPALKSEPATLDGLVALVRSFKG